MDRPEMGTCSKCGLENVPVKSYRNILYCRFCLPHEKDCTPIKAKMKEKPVDDFNNMIRKTQNIPT